MRQFFIRVLRWLATFLTAYIILAFTLFFVLAIFLVAIQPKPELIEKDSVLVFDLGISITDMPASENLSSVIEKARGGDGLQQIHLKRLLAVLDQGLSDPNISGVLLIGNLNSGGYGNSLASLAEVRSKLKSYSASGKFIWSYLDGDSLRDYYVKSVADSVFAHPGSFLGFRGLNAERMYMATLFEKLGVEVQVVQQGKYKTAFDSFEETEMVPEEREALSVLVSNIWSELLKDIDSSRKVSVDRLDVVANENAFLRVEDANAAGMIDDILYKDELIERLISKVGLQGERSVFKQISMGAYVDRVTPVNTDFLTSTWKNKIGIVYVEGAIVSGEIEEGYAGADEISRTLRKLRKDDTVRAVVMRVNSPGGSAVASEKIAREIELMKELKPVVVSFGGMAASGGYWISTPAEYIFADSYTITGSIGVIGMLPNAENLLDKIGVNVDGVQTSQFSDSFSISRSKSELEMQQFDRFLSLTYDEFIARVAKGRNLEISHVELIAQGRVWTGSDALRVGLIDEIGGLSASIQKAAELAMLGNDYKIQEFPKEGNFEDFINSLTGRSGGNVKSSIPSVFDPYVSGVLENIKLLDRLSDKDHIYAALPYHLIIE